MRRLVAVLLAVPVLLGACASADPIEVDTQSNTRIAEEAARRVAVLQLTAVAQAAQSYAQLNGSTTGFASAVAAENPQVAERLVAFTDTSATVRYGLNKCLVQLLPTGTPTDMTC